MDNTLKIKKTEDTPEIDFDAVSGILTLTGESMPENALDFYAPIVNWISAFLETNFQKAEIRFMLSYFNTASAKQIARILTMMQNSSRSNNIIVKWYYGKDDTEALEAGKRYSSLKLNFEYIELDVPLCDVDPDEPEGVYYTV